jgi:transposase
MAMKARKQPAWTVAHPDAAAIDVGAYSHFVSVPDDRHETPVREFGCHTAQLDQLADWLHECSIKTVALESTGVYWIPVYEVLEARGLDVWLVNPKHTRNVTGRKSDVLDCQWLQQLHTFGLLNRAFRPEAGVCEVRELARLRDTMIDERTRHVQRMQSALTQMNVQLTSVLADIAGETGMAIIRAIVAGKRDAEELAQLRNYRVHASQEQVAAALRGTWKREHLFKLSHELACYDFVNTRLAMIDAELEQLLRGLAVQDRQPQVRRQARAKNAPKFDVRRALLNWSGVDLTEVPGIEAITAMKVLAELGPDLQRFKTSKSFCSWLGLCPGTRITGGKRIDGKSKRLPNRVSQALKEAATGLARSKCAMGAYYRRLVMRMSTSKAITAVAHKLARIIYAMLTGQSEYEAQRMQMHDHQHRQRALRALRTRASELGFELVERPPAPAV